MTIKNDHFPSLLDELRGQRLLHLAHRGADCDALGSAYALSRLLPGDIGCAEDMKASAYELAAWLEIEPVLDPDPAAYDYTIIYDLFTPHMLGTPVPPAYSLFDHHIAGGRPYVARHNELAAGADYAWVWPVEATCSILVDLFLAHEIPFERKTAVALAAGIITDTSMLKIANGAAFQRLAALLAPHGLYYADVMAAIDPPRCNQVRRTALLQAMRHIQETRLGPWSLLASETDSHSHGFDVLSALARLGDAGMVCFPKSGNNMLMVECTPTLVEETGVDLGELATRVAASVGAAESWGNPTGGRIIAPLPAETLSQRYTQALVEALRDNHCSK